MSDRIANNQLDALADTLFGKSGSGQSGQIRSLFTSLFRANGGDVRAGQPVNVGEYGREVFVPDSNGRVYPVGQGNAPGVSGGFRQETHYHNYAGVPVQEKTTSNGPNRRTDVIIGDMVATGLKTPHGRQAARGMPLIST